MAKLLAQARIITAILAERSPEFLADPDCDEHELALETHERLNRLAVKIAEALELTPEETRVFLSEAGCYDELPEDPRPGHHPAEPGPAPLAR